MESSTFEVRDGGVLHVDDEILYSSKTVHGSMSKIEMLKE